MRSYCAAAARHWTDAGGEYKDGNTELCPFCLFNAEETLPSVKRYAEVFNLLIRKHRCAQPPSVRSRTPETAGR